jgi:hypothetical protein
MISQWVKFIEMLQYVKIYYWGVYEYMVFSSVPCFVLTFAICLQCFPLKAEWSRSLSSLILVWIYLTSYSLPVLKILLYLIWLNERKPCSLYRQISRLRSTALFAICPETRPAFFSDLQHIYHTLVYIGQLVCTHTHTHIYQVQGFPSNATLISIVVFR